MMLCIFNSRIELRVQRICFHVIIMLIFERFISFPDEIYFLLFFLRAPTGSKNTMQTLKHPSADEVTHNVHKSDITASLCQ